MKSTTLTLILSTAAVLGYLSYRALAPVPTAEPPRALEQPPEAQQQSSGSALVDSLPDFALGNLAGESQSIQSWPGKALIINFWATWCPPCLREIPMLKEFQQTHADDPIQVVGIAVDQRDAVADFAADIEFNYPVLVGQSEAMDAASAFGVEFVGLPFTVFTDANGHVLGVHTGELHAEHLQALVDVLAAEQAGKLDLEGARATLAGRR
jgi:thiol-disulfide isomerase/thioredoxin